MFQSFDNPASAADTRDRIIGLRKLLAASSLDGFLIPRADEHQGEYVAPSSERLAWITGFTGSAGLAIVARKKAVLFVDGRYTVQAPTQIDTDLFDIAQVPRNKPRDWLLEHIPKGGAIGFDPWLHTISQINELHKALKPAGITLKPVARNLVDRVWGVERPALPTAPVTVHALSHAGISAKDKIKTLQKTLIAAGQEATILTAPDSICWLFNIRGADVAHNPVALSFAIIPAKGMPQLFIDPQKLNTKAQKHLRALASLVAPRDLDDAIKDLRAAKAIVRLDKTAAPWRINTQLGATFNRTPATVVNGPDPCVMPKAVKNATEIEGTRNAHLRDGSAVVRFLAWLDNKVATGVLDEITAVKQLEAFRQQTGALREISFDTISGSGPNGAIVHYRVTQGSNRKFKSSELYLVDSGAQYIDGTTDITRTIAIGKPSAEMRRRFTGVLKGHIAIATARFPEGTRGLDLDPFARRALWDMGLDYDHGTGHGVGSYLSVHEGPQSISRAGKTPLQPGMIISNEPGYYKHGAYGIRLENLVLVTKGEKISGAERDMMGFETLTLAPFDCRLIDAAALTGSELDWLNAYHRRVAKLLKPDLDKATRDWLLNATKPIASTS